MNPNLILIVGGGLGLGLLVVGLGLTLFGERSVVEERLGRYSEGGQVVVARPDSESQGPQTTFITDFFERLGEGSAIFDKIATNLAQADLKFRPAEFIALIVASSIITGFVGFVISSYSIFFAIVSMIVGMFIPNIYVKSSTKNRLKKFDNQLGDMLNLTVNGLRAGFSTLQAMEAVSRELPAPICEEFRRVVQEMQLGLPMEETLEHLIRRINSDDLDLVITAINVQREVGGNLAEILDTISFTIRERVRIKGEIQALTAQGRATAWVISALPIILVLLLFLLNREYVMTFFDPDTRSCGIPILVTAGLMVIGGFVAAQKIVDIDI